ncbi:MAG: 4Fe-4S dicluster domain-containing protein [Candidatus Helarchaeota archaeon]
MNMIDNYEKIRQKLNVKGQGAPKHKKVIEFLKVIWNEDDIQILNHFDGVGKLLSARKLAKKAGLDKERVKNTLDKLARKGTIIKIGNQYGLLPFVPGIFELYFLTQKDTEENYRKASFIMEEIIDDVLPGLTITGKNKLFRPKLSLGAQEKIIKIDEKINSSSQILPFELVESMISKTDFYAKIPCQCRMVGDFIGDPCTIAPKDVGCFVAGMAARQVVAMGLGEELTKDEAIAYLKKAEKAGLVHNGGNIAGDASNLLICNCCPCHCGALKPQAKHKIGAINPSNFQPMIDEQICVKCGTCVKICPVGAIFHKWATQPDSSDEKIIIKNDYCIGCGVCAATCPKSAIKMEKVRAEVPKANLPIGLELFGM